MKFKKGQQVKIIKNNDDKKFNKYIGTTATITYVNKEWYELDIENGTCWDEDEVELVQPKKFTKSDLKDEDIVTLRNNEKMIYSDKSFLDLSNDNDNTICDLEDLDSDLTCKDEDSDYDVIKIERAKEYEVVWTREEETTKEMTVAEIEKELGYKVKIVKGEK